MAFQDKLEIKPKGRRPDLTGYIGEEKVSLWFNDEIRTKLAKLLG